MKYQLKNTLLALIVSLFVSFPAVAEKEAPESIPGTTRVTANEVIDLITNSSDLVIIDARKDTDRESAGWIEGSVALPNYDTTEDTLAQNIPSKSTPVVFYCNGVKCGRSVESANKAVALLYDKVYWFRGGWEEWMAEGLPVSNDE